MRLIQIFCCSLLVIGSSCTGPSRPDKETALRLYQEAKSLGRRDDTDQMLDLYRQAVEHDPEYTEAHWEVISFTDDKEWLRRDYERRVRETPNSGVFQYLLGEVSEGETKRIQYEKAIELDPHYPWGYLGLGELLAFEFLVLTATRSGEVLRAVFMEIDRDEGVWTIPAALAHVVKNKVKAAYRRSDLFARRRWLMDDWASYLAGEDRNLEAGPIQ